jgi:hypothetical protein
VTNMGLVVYVVDRRGEIKRLVLSHGPILGGRVSPIFRVSGAQRGQRPHALAFPQRR